MVTLGMIKTKSIYHDSMEPGDGYRLLVMRYWPRGVVKERVNGWIKDLGPSPSLLGSLKEGRMDWPAFVAGYRLEVEGTARGQALLEEVQRLEETHGTVTLLCHEDLSSPGAHCHREILKEMLSTRRPQ